MQAINYAIDNKLTWEEMLRRNNGTYEPRVIQYALDNYKASNPDRFKEATVRIEGYNEWLAKNK